MQLHISKSKNSVIYYVAESFRKDGKVTSRNIERIGSHQELLDRGIADPKAYAQNRVSQINAEIRDEVVSINQTIDFKSELEASCLSSKSTLLNVGWLYIHRIFSQLQLRDFLKSISGRSAYDLNAVVEYYVANRFLSPGSKREAFLRKGEMLGSPDYSLDDGYRALTPLDAHNDELQRLLFEGTKRIIGLDTDVLYYDCTNFYFESEDQDDNLYNEDGDIVQWGLRRYGASKEHRPNPIVQMGLFTDKNGIPMSYCVHHGSNNEQNTVIPLESRMIRDYRTSKFIYCSDGGLGSFDNRFFNTFQGRDYVVTQSLKKTAQEELDCILKDLNWRYVDPLCDGGGREIAPSLAAFKSILDKRYRGEELTEEELLIVSRDMIYKPYPVTRKIPSRFLKGLRLSGSVEMEETVYVTFSAKYYLYQKQLFERQLAAAQEWIDTKDPDNIKKGPNDIRRFIKTISSTKEGEIAEKKTNVIDEERVAYERKFHGFYAIATSLEGKTVKEILDINASRWRIEQSFRILKTDFDTRPIYASTPEHIRGHIAVCYMALLIYRILERQLHLQNPDETYSSSQIIETMRNMNVIDQQNSYYQSVYTGSHILNALERLYPCGLNKKYYKPKPLKQKFRQ